MPRLPRLGLALCLLPIAGACQTYEPKPLDLAAHEQTWSSRAVDGPEVQAFAQALDPSLAAGSGAVAPSAADGLDLDEAAMVALAYNAELRRARAALAVAMANEANAGLWDDPVFEMDVLRIVENVPADPWVIPMAIGFTVPLSGRLEVEKSLARSEHRAAASEVLLREWETVSALRDVWFEWSAATLQAELSRQVIERIDVTLRVVDRLEQSGQLSRMEARLFRLERATRETDRIRAEARAATLALRLRALMGLRPDADVPLLPRLAMGATGPATGEATGAAITRSSPMLALARAEYEVAEEALHLEVRRQYPDLTIGPAFERDQDQSRVGLVMGIPIPILNANRAGIAEALAHREQLRVAFEAEYERLMAELAEAQVAAEAATALRVEVERTLVPLADAQIADQARMAELGQLSALLTLETVIRGQDIKVKLVEARLEEAKAANRVRTIAGPRRDGTQFDEGAQP